MRLLNRRETSAHGGRLTSLNYGYESILGLGDMSKKADCRHQSGAKESNDYDLQVCAPIRVIH